MPWTGGAFLVGAMAIAGLPPLNGFASEWLTLQALLHVPAYGGARRRHWPARSRSRRSPRPRRSRSSASSRSSGSCCSGRRGASAVAAATRGAAADARAPSSSSRGACVVLGVAPGPARSASLVGLAPWPASTPTHARAAPARHRLAADGRDRARARRADRRRSSLLRGRRRAAPAPTLGVRPARRAASSTGRAPGSRSRCGSCSRRSSGPSARSPCAATGGVVQEVAYSGRVPHLIDERVYRPRRAALARGAAARAAAAERQPRHVRRLPDRARARAARRGAGSGVIG